MWAWATAAAAGDDGNFIELSKKQNADFSSIAEGFDDEILSRFQSQYEYSLEMYITGTIHYSAVPVPMQSRRLSCCV